MTNLKLMYLEFTSRYEMYVSKPDIFTDSYIIYQYFLL